MTQDKRKNNPSNYFEPDFVAQRENYTPSSPEYVASVTQELQHKGKKTSQDYLSSDSERKKDAEHARKKNGDRKDDSKKGLNPSSIEFNNDDANRGETDLFCEGYKYLKAVYGDDIRITATPDAVHGLVDIALLKPLKYGLDAQEHHGLKIPYNTNSYQSVTRVDFELYSHLKALYKDTFKFWGSMYTGHQGALSRYLKIAPLEVVKLNKTVSYQGNPAHKVVPKLEWFDERIQQIDPLSLLTTIMRPAEAKATMLHIGRIAAGAPVDRESLAENGNPGCDTAESMGCTVNHKYGNQVNYIDYHYRMLYVLTGEPEVGKSTLWSYINTAFTSCGYTRAIFPQSFNQFNWQGATKDILFCEDMSKDSTSKMQIGVAASTLKSVVSGGDISIEPKGVDAFSARAKAAVVFLANNIEFPKRNQMDDGIENRIHYLQCKPKSVMQSEGVKNLGSAWEKICNDMNTTPKVLTLYLIRKSLDQFLELNGYTWVDADEYATGGYYDYYPENKKLKEYSDEIRKDYSFKPPTDLIKELTTACRKATLMSTIGGQQLPDEYDLGFNIFHLEHLSRTLVNLKKAIQTFKNGNETGKAEKLEKIYDFLAPSGILNKTWEKFGIIMQVAIGASGNKTLEDLWTANIENLTTVDGDTAPKVRKWYAEAYKKAKDAEEGYRYELQQFAESIDLDLNICAAIVSTEFRNLI